ncbi:MAG: hypothetical protein ABR956_18130 [Terracidiphilus sp.]|jgi:hypothetical protein
MTTFPDAAAFSRTDPLAEAQLMLNEGIGLTSTIGNSGWPLRSHISRFEDSQTVPTS